MAELTNDELTPDPNATTTVEAEAAASEANAGNVIADAVDNLVAQIKAGALRVEEVARAPRPEAPAPKPQLDPAAMQRINALLEENPALKTYTNDVLIPAIMSNVERDAKRERRNMERDPQLGALFRKNADKIEELKRTRNIGDAFIVDHGYEDLLKIVDPEGYVEATKVATNVPPAPKAALTPEQPAAPRMPRTEGAHVGVIGARPTPLAQTREAQIAAVPVTDAEVESARRFYGMSKAQFQEQRLEMKEQRARLGEEFTSLFGTPICNLQDRMPRRQNADGTLGDYIVRVQED